MHHLHFRYVTEQPQNQNLDELFPLLDSLSTIRRARLFRDVHVHLGVPHESDDFTNEREREAAEFLRLKSILRALMKPIRDEEILTYGLVCFILGNACRRIESLIGFIQQQRGHIDACRQVTEMTIADSDDRDEMPRSQQTGITVALDNIESLRREQEELRLAYIEFCEQVVGPLLDDSPHPPDA